MAIAGTSKTITDPLGELYGLDLDDVAAFPYDGDEAASTAAFGPDDLDETGAQTFDLLDGPDLSELEELDGPDSALTDEELALKVVALISDLHDFGPHVRIKGHGPYSDFAYDDEGYLVTFVRVGLN